MPYRIAMIGAGSAGFSLAISKELVRSEYLQDSTFVLMDIDSKKLAESEARIKSLITPTNTPPRLESTLDRRAAISEADFVVTSYICTSILPLSTWAFAIRFMAASG